VKAVQENNCPAAAASDDLEVDVADRKAIAA